MRADIEWISTANQALIVMARPALALWRWLRVRADELLDRFLGAPAPPIPVSCPPAPAPATVRASRPKEPEPLRYGDSLNVDRTRGGLTLLEGGVALIEGATASVSYSCAGETATLSSAGPTAQVAERDGALCLRRRDDHLELIWSVTLATPHELWLDIRNIGAAQVNVEQLRVLEVSAAAGGRLGLSAAPRRWSVYQHGWGSWTPTLARSLNESSYAPPADEQFARLHLPHGAPPADIISSEWLTVLYGRGGGGRAEGRAQLLGFISGATQLAELRVQAAADAFGSVQAICHADGVLLEAGQTLCSERLLITAGADPLALLEAYADRVGSAMAARRPAGVPTGWCTWYYFYGENGEAEVSENLVEMGREHLPLDYVIIDDGYQRAIGDWLTLAPDRYPDMAQLAQKIHAEGRRAGIWVAPFGLAADSDAYMAHPDWTVRDDAGAPVVAWQHFGQTIYALDLSHPEVAPWLTDVFRSMRQEWGYSLFKIDFLFAACAAGRRHDPHMTRAAALRRGLEVIRAAIGEDAFLLGCGAPQLPCVGVVDGMRVGPDVASYWHPLGRGDQSQPSAENALRTSIARYFSHGRLWLNDPDCVLLRERGDSSDLVLSEMRALAGIIALLGGVTISSDHLPGLRKGRFKYLEQMLPPSGVSARPLDLFENELPECLALTVSRPWGSWRVVGVMNWQDSIRSTEVDLRALGLPAGQYHVFNYWPRNDMGIANQFVAIDRHLPHELVILLFKPVSAQPELFTTTFHIAQTLSEVQSVERKANADGSVTLTVLMQHAGSQAGEVWFTFPPQWGVQAAWVDGRKRKVSSAGVGVAHLGLTLDGKAKIEVQFAPLGA